MSYYFNRYIFLILVLLTSGCASSIDVNFRSSSKVHLKHTKKFFISKTKKQKMSVKFDKYADHISYRMQKAGWKRVKKIKKADYIVSVNYNSVRKKRVYKKTYKKIQHKHINGYSSIHGHNHKVVTKKSIVVKPSSHDKYKHALKIKIVSHPDKKIFYESKVTSDLLNNAFPKVSKCMIDAALNRFPYRTTGANMIIKNNCGI